MHQRKSNKKLHRIFQCALVLRALCNVLIFSLKLCSIHLSTRHSHTYPTIFKPYQFTAFSSYPVYSIWTFVVGFFSIDFPLYLDLLDCFSFFKHVFLFFYHVFLFFYHAFLFFKHVFLFFYHVFYFLIHFSNFLITFFYFLIMFFTFLIIFFILSTCQNMVNFHSTKFDCLSSIWHPHLNFTPSVCLWFPVNFADFSRLT